LLDTHPSGSPIQDHGGDVVSGQRVSYIWVSSLGRNPDRQLDGVEVDTLFTDTVSGESTIRPQQTMLATIESCLYHPRRTEPLSNPEWFRGG
jgi:hypothetical protein